MSKMTVEKILARLDQLIEEGERVLGTKHTPSSGSGVVLISPSEFVEEGPFHMWRVSSLALLNTLPKDYVYYREFEAGCKVVRSDNTQRGLSILMAARDGIRGGYLQKVETLVSAEVFNDFLEMAEHLSDNGYKDPAASLVGAVLEDGLRRICVSNDLTVKSEDNISSLNKKLADKPVYNRLQQREIEAWNKLRDYADHGHFGEYDAKKVSNMLQGVRNFLVSQLT